MALRYGPLIDNSESVDQNADSILSPTATFATEWRPDLLGGMLDRFTIHSVALNDHTAKNP